MEIIEQQFINLEWGEIHNLGDITKLVEKNEKDEEKNNYLYIRKPFNLEKVQINDFKGEFHLIMIEKFKELFGICKTGRHIAKYNKRNIIISRIENTIELKKYLTDNDISIKKLPPELRKEICKVIAFKWIFCMKNINEKSIYLRFINDKHIEVLSFKEENYNYQKDDITARIIKDWFEKGYEGFHNICKELIGGRDISLLRIQIQKIIQSLDRNFIPWSNEIFNRLLNFY